MAAKFTVV